MTVEAPLAPAFAVTAEGVASTWKSCTVTETVAECDSDPLVPVAVTV